MKKAWRKRGDAVVLHDERGDLRTVGKHTRVEGGYFIVSDVAVINEEQKNSIHAWERIRRKTSLYVDYIIMERSPTKLSMLQLKKGYQVFERVFLNEGDGIVSARPRL